MEAFSFRAVRTVSEALEVIREHPPNEVALMGGGTDLLIRERQKLVSFRVLLFLRSIPELSKIRLEMERGLTIGAAATLDEVANHFEIRRRYPMLSQAARSVASPQIRHKATIGGNLCLASRCWFYNRSPFWRAEYPRCRKASGGDQCYIVPKSRKGCFALQSGDTVGPLVALQAKVKLVSERGERLLDIENFFLGDGIEYLDLKPDEILTEVILPWPLTAGVFVKFRPQNNLDFATFTLSVIPPRNGSGSRIVVGSVANRPLRARKAETLLDQREVGVDVIAQQAAEELPLISFVRGSVEFKRRAIKAKLEEVLKDFVSSPSREN